MFEVRFESTSGARWRIGWWLATIGAGLTAASVAAAVVAPQVSRSDSEGVIYFAIGVTAATAGFIAFVVGRNLMLRRIVSRVADDIDTADADGGDASLTDQK
ncbi:MAG: hypothetical protein GC190_11815 [Alphaproteobacteria bacterium]|nr:hypothetical protein [Alphaproteobacteria bacterium]